MGRGLGSTKVGLGDHSPVGNFPRQKGEAMNLHPDRAHQNRWREHPRFRYRKKRRGASVWPGNSSNPTPLIGRSGDPLESMLVARVGFHQTSLELAEKRDPV